MIQKRGVPALVIAMTAIFISIPGNVGAEDTSQAPSMVVAANTRFAFKFFHLLVHKTSDQNVLIAPTGLSLTFALLDNGADAETRKEIETTFEFNGLSLVQLNQGFANLREVLQPIMPPKLMKKPWGMTPTQWKQFQTAPPSGIIIADSVWFKRGVAFSPIFSGTNRRYYGLDCKRFLPTPTPSIQVSNWARQRTRKNTPIHVGSLFGKSDFLFVDVTYFHEFWADQFDQSATKLDFFTLQSGSKKEVPFMHQRREFRYFDGEDFQAVVLPYGSESMYVFLPSEASNLTRFENSLTPENWNAWLSRFESRPGHVGLPKFGITSSVNIRSALESMGVSRAFNTLEAFSPLASQGVMLTSASQNTSLKVDEQGTEGISIGLIAGVVGGVMGGRLGPPPKPFEMIVNRPFFFAIANSQTKQLLFLGAVVEP